jgi:hypothetical protein
MHRRGFDHSTNDNKYIDVDLYRFNYSCVPDLTNASVYNSFSCWIKLEDLYNEGSAGSPVSWTYKNIDFAIDNVILNGTDLYMISSYMNKQISGGETVYEVLRISNRSLPITENDPLKYVHHSVNSGATSGTLFSQNETFYSSLEGVYLSSCSGFNCSGVSVPANQTYNLSNVSYITISDRNKVLGNLLNTQGEENPEQNSKINLKGLLGTGIITGGILTGVASFTLSPLILVASLFMLLSLCSLLGLFPFWIILVSFVGLLAIAIFKYFKGGNNYNG